MELEQRGRRLRADGCSGVEADGWMVQAGRFAEPPTGHLPLGGLDGLDHGVWDVLEPLVRARIDPALGCHADPWGEEVDGAMDTIAEPQATSQRVWRARRVSQD